MTGYQMYKRKFMFVDEVISVANIFNIIYLKINFMRKYGRWVIGTNQSLIDCINQSNILSLITNKKKWEKNQFPSIIE